VSVAPARWAAGLRALPDFPWDRLIPFQRTAAAHPGGLVDLSVGTPVDSTPAFVQHALREASDAPGYPLTIGTPELREAMRGWLARHCGAREDIAAIPSIGLKEIVGLLAALLGVGPQDTVVVPSLAYPTYAVGATLVGARVSTEWDPSATVVWINSPSNPTGAVTSREELADTVARCRAAGALLVSDECYLAFGYDGVRPVSVLDPSICGGSYDGIVALHSLSKQSNLAGYRAGIISGDAAVVQALLEVRRHTGFLMPTPVQAAAAAALRDDVHVEEQRDRYVARRAVLRPALESAGFRIDHSQAGLYLWATRGEPALDTVGWLAERGILCAPGDFYGAAGAQHVRIAMTATDERIAAAAKRIAG
jgi:succinyldiaminopimelate transaminase